MMNPSEVIPIQTAEHPIPKMLHDQLPSISKIALPKPQAKMQSSDPSLIQDDSTIKERGPFTLKEIIRFLSGPGPKHAGDGPVKRE